MKTLKFLFWAAFVAGMFLLDCLFRREPKEADDGKNS